MIKLLILADDFTGALDTGVQLAKSGAVTHVVTDLDINFDSCDPEMEVLVIDTETRHLSADSAHEVIYKITKKAVDSGINFIYKKTDSALRGNIGAELDAVLKSSGADKLFFIPAFPKLQRNTHNGIHFFEGVPIHETVFGNDPFEPVEESYVPNLIGKQSEISIILVREGEIIPEKNESDKEIILFDALSDETLAEIARNFEPNESINVFAGCAGFAEYLPNILNLQRHVKAVSASTSGILVVSGSLNPITAKQLEIAHEAGFECAFLTSEQKLNGIPETNDGNLFIDEIIEKYNRFRCLFIAGMGDISVKEGDDSFEKEGYIVAENMGNLVRRLFEKGLRGTVAVTGGDTLKGVLKSLGCTDIVPVCEIETGVVLSKVNMEKGNLMVVSKSGGIGTDEVFVRVAEYFDIELPRMAAN